MMNHSKMVMIIIIISAAAAAAAVAVRSVTGTVTVTVIDDQLLLLLRNVAHQLVFKLDLSNEPPPPPQQRLPIQMTAKQNPFRNRESKTINFANSTFYIFL